MHRQLNARLDRLERNSGEPGDALFLLWLRPGENGEEAAQRERDARPELTGVPIHVFTWTDHEPPPSARWTTVEALSDAELAQVIDGICEAGISAGIDHPSGSSSEMSHLTDRELVASALGIKFT